MLPFQSLGCGDVIDVSETGKLTSPDYPEPYSTDENCTWILAADPESKIALKFEDFDLQPPSGSQCLDYFEIRDGQLGKLLIPHDQLSDFELAVAFCRIQFF